MYGVIAAREVLNLLLRNELLSPVELTVCQDRISQLDNGTSPVEFDPDTILMAVFNGVNGPAYDFVLDWDHSHLHPSRRDVPRS